MCIPWDQSYKSLRPSMQNHSTQFKTFITVVYGDVYFLNLETQIPPSLYAEFKVHGLRLYNWNVGPYVFPES